MRLLLLLFIAFPLAGQTGYFQQAVDYALDVRLDDEAHTVTGTARITYTNNAPHALDSLVFHCWPRAFSSDESAFARQQLRNGSTRFHFAPREARGTMDSLDFRVDGKPVAIDFNRDSPDIGVLRLTTPVAAGQTVTIETPFRVRVPESFSRLGHVGQSYQITQWYPKPAVYDREGWHAMPYLDQGEFYSEFGDFDVRITLPANYVVGATGELQEASEKQWMLDKAASTRKSLTNYEQNVNYGYVDELFPASASTTKTLSYRAENVHDFAWFADKRFLVLHDTLNLRSVAKEIDVWALFTQTESALWKDATEYLKRATRFYSEHVGPYPYPQVTGVQSALSAGAGMEYPMITVIGLSGSAYALDEVLAHEIGHNWFYGMLGSNERDHPWMDEGLNSYYESRYTRAFYPERDGRIQLIPGREVDADRVAYRYLARLGRDQAPDTPSDSLEQYNYWMGAYSKPELVLTAVEERVGIAALDRAFQDYFERWRFRHPAPGDFYAALASMGEADYVQDAMETTTRGAYNGKAWERPAAEGSRIPRLALITDAQSGRPTLFWTPLLGFNANDGVMPGLALHNRTLEPRRLEFLLAPLYGLHSKSLAGMAGLRYRLTRPTEWLQRVTVSGGVQRFSDFDPPAANVPGVYDYDRWAVRTDFYLDHPPISLRESRLYSQYVRLNRRRPAFAEGGILLPEAVTVHTDLLRIGYAGRVRREIDPVAYALRAEYRRGDPDRFSPVNYLKLEGEYRVGYQYRKNKYVRGRVFAGYFPRHDRKEGTGSPEFSLSLYDNAASDYGYDNLYLGRGEGGGYEQQSEVRQGGFRVPVSAAFPDGRSNQFLAAVNLDADVPFPILPLGIYVDAGAYGYRATLTSGQETRVGYVGGLSLNLLANRFHLYLPLVADADTRRLLEQPGEIWNRLVFRLDLAGLLPWRWIDDLP